MISSSAYLNLGTYASSTADTLWFDGVAQAAGVWGPVGSGAAHESARFTGTSGRLTVARVACTPPSAPIANSPQVKT